MKIRLGESCHFGSTPRHVMKKSPRERRLDADYQSVRKLMSESSIFSFEASGATPTRYEFRFHGKGLARDKAGTIYVAEKHEVVVELGASYPRLIPTLAWQSPIFHPNISNNGVVCLGGYGTHWVPSLTLNAMCTMLWDMIRYKNFDAQSPYNRDAAMWAVHQTDFQLPLDHRSIRDLHNTAAEPDIVIDDAPPVAAVTFTGEVVASEDVQIISDEVTESLSNAEICFID